MKRYSLAVLFPILFTICACTSGYERPNEVDPKDFNEKIFYGKKTNADWVTSPQHIAKQFFPRDEDKASYSIEEKHISEVVRRITITEEGGFDDEVTGEKAIIDFKLKNDRWEITKMYISLKRRY